MALLKGNWLITKGAVCLEYKQRYRCGTDRVLRTLLYPYLGAKMRKCTGMRSDFLKRPDRRKDKPVIDLKETGSTNTHWRR